jgi:hypothetical protein
MRNRKVRQWDVRGTSLSKSRMKYSGHSSFLTCVSSLESVDNPSSSNISGGTKTEGRINAGEVAGSRSLYSA